ncbi:MAG: hypothetical protein ACYC0Q_01385 [Eubacteriales bacterium]
MFQLGNFHIGTSEKAKEPVLNSGEAHILWNQLASRYDCIEKTQIYLEFAHDPDFRFMLQKELSNILEKQADELEKPLQQA